MTQLWFENAPNCMISAYKNGRIRNGRPLLEQILIRGERVGSPWTELARHANSDEEWYRVWGAIAYAKKKSSETKKFRKSRRDERDEYKWIADNLKELAQKIENGPLDVLAYKLLGPDDWAALHHQHFNELSSDRQFEVAHKILPSWPSVTDLLKGLETLASASAKDAMTKARPDTRSGGDVARRTFVWHLGEGFQRIFGKNLLGTVATMTKEPLNKLGL
jgi:hypothetical protein